MFCNSLFISFGAILSFSSGYYNYPTLSFISGAVSTISLAFLQFSSFAYKEKNRNIEELNQMLTKLNLETVPTEENDKKNDNIPALWLSGVRAVAAIRIRSKDRVRIQRPGKATCRAFPTCGVGVHPKPFLFD